MSYDEFPHSKGIPKHYGPVEDDLGIFGPLPDGLVTAFKLTNPEITHRLEYNPEKGIWEEARGKMIFIDRITRQLFIDVKKAVALATKHFPMGPNPPIVIQSQDQTSN